MSCKYIIFSLFKFYATDYPVCIEKVWDVDIVTIAIISTAYIQLEVVTVAHVLRENAQGKWNWMASGKA